MSGRPLPLPPQFFAGLPQDLRRRFQGNFASKKSVHERWNSQAQTSTSLHALSFDKRSIQENLWKIHGKSPGEATANQGSGPILHPSPSCSSRHPYPFHSHPCPCSSRCNKIGGKGLAVFNVLYIRRFLTNQAWSSMICVQYIFALMLTVQKWCSL